MEKVLEKTMFNYFTQLNEQEKKSVIRMLESFLNGKLENKKRISIDDYNKDLENAMEEVRKGEVYAHDEVEKMSKDW